MSIENFSLGLPSLDKATGGLAPGSFNVLAGPPSSGKSALALNIASGACLDRGKAVLFISYQMMTNASIDRIVGSRLSIDTRDLRPGRISLAEIQGTIDELNRSKLSYRPAGGDTLQEITEGCAQITHSLDLVVIDQIQNIPGNSVDRQNLGFYENIIKQANDAKALARALNTPFLVTMGTRSSVDHDELISEGYGIDESNDEVPNYFREIYSMADIYIELPQAPNSSVEAPDATDVPVYVRKPRRSSFRLTFRRPFTRFDELNSR